MNSILKHILETRLVSDGSENFQLRANVDFAEGSMIQRVIRKIKARKGMEIGLAYGISALFACEAMAEGCPDFSELRYVGVDPSQHSVWKGIGLRNLSRAGYYFFEHLEKGSELALPQLLAESSQFDFIFVDGWHTFDHTLIDCFYATRLLSVGGALVIDDVRLPAVNKVIKYLLKYPCYKILDLAYVESVDDESVSRDYDFIESWNGVPNGKYVTSIALIKVAEDSRSWDWFSDF